MPSIISHPVVPVSIACLVGTEIIPPRLILVGRIASVLPDADVLGYWLGIPYDHLFGHRGFSHSPAFALLIAFVGLYFWRRLDGTPLSVFVFLFLSVASHGLLDAATNGGLGVAFLSPFSNERYFLPWQPILVSPMAINHFFSAWGWGVVQSELMWIWLPFLSLGVFGLLVRNAARWRANS